MPSTDVPPSGVRAILFDVFGTVVDWRSSLIDELSAWGEACGVGADWTALVDLWRAAYVPSMDRVRRGEQPWTTLDALHRQSLAALVQEMGVAGLSPDDLDHLTRAWHRLRPWPDSVAGIERLRTRFIVGPLSNGNLSLQVDLARHAGLRWDVVFGSDVFGRFKPDPEVYLGACRLLDLAPAQVMLCAAHNGDLSAAQALGLRTAFVPRPTEYGPAQVRDRQAEGAWDAVARDIDCLSRSLTV